MLPSLFINELQSITVCEPPVAMMRTIILNRQLLFGICHIQIEQPARIRNANRHIDTGTAQTIAHQQQTQPGLLRRISALPHQPHRPAHRPEPPRKPQTPRLRLLTQILQQPNKIFYPYATRITPHHRITEHNQLLQRQPSSVHRPHIHRMNAAKPATLQNYRLETSRPSDETHAFHSPAITLVVNCCVHHIVL